MPKWVIACPGCGRTFTHTTVTEPKMLEMVRRDPYLANSRPVVPPDGEKRQCPSCKYNVLIKSCHLSYSYL